MPALPALRLARRPTLTAVRLAATRAQSTSIMDTSFLNESQLAVRDAVAKVCEPFDNAWWRDREATKADPKEFHKAFADSGFLGIALPERFGGSGLGLQEAAIMMQTITESGAGFPGAQATHGNIYATQPLGIFGTDAQREKFIPKIVSGEWRTCFGVTGELRRGVDGWAASSRDTGNDVMMATWPWLQSWHGRWWCLAVAQCTMSMHCWCAHTHTPHASDRDAVLLLPAACPSRMRREALPTADRDTERRDTDRCLRATAFPALLSSRPH